MARINDLPTAYASPFIYCSNFKVATPATVRGGQNKGWGWGGGGLPVN